MIEANVEEFLSRHAFSLEHKKIVVGVSGGPDSLALLHFLIELQRKKGLSLVTAHVDHMIRGQESYEDAMFVKRFSEQNDIPFEMVQINVPERMKQTGNSLEIEAREARYAFFAEVMEKYEYPYLALGHHGEDQIETILMRLTRGSTGSARAGIPFTRSFANGCIFRPFLNLSKREIGQYCQINSLEPREDSSNQTSVYIRNRFRKEVLPFLKQENQHVHEHFQRFSEELQSDESYLQELTVQRMNTVMTIDENHIVTMDIKRFLKMPLPLQRRGIQLILNYLYKERPASLSVVHIHQIFHLIHHNLPSGRLDLPSGLKVIRSYTSLSFQFKMADASTYYFEMNQSGTCELPHGSSIKVEYIDKHDPVSNPFVAYFNEEDVKWPLKIRTRKHGDRMTLKGMNGSKKIKDIFIDQKISIQERDRWPVITDADDSIIWLPGLKKSSIEGVKENAKKHILLTFYKEANF